MDGDARAGPPPGTAAGAEGDRARPCPACEAPIVVFSDTARAACAACHALFDVEADTLVFCEQLEQERLEPILRLGGEGRLLGERLTVAAIWERFTIVDGATHRFREYLLRVDGGEGHRWLVEDAGHWLWLAPIDPRDVTEARVRYDGRSHRRHGARTVTLRYVAGALPWKVEMGERATVTTYVAPPHLVREERSTKERRFFGGRSLEGATIFEAFGLAGAPPTPVGIAPAQPNPHPWPPVTAAFVAILLTFLGVGAGLDWGREPRMLHRGELALPAAPVVPSSPRVLPDSDTDRGTVTAPFTVIGDPSTVGVHLTTEASSDLVGLACALIDEDRGEVREVHLQAGARSAGEEGLEHEAWAHLDRIPAGRYTLRIESEWTQQRAGDGARFGRSEAPPRASLEVLEGARSPWCALVAFTLLLVPFALLLLLRARFERRRWALRGTLDA